MPSWRDEYLGALEERDKKEKVNQSLYHSYARLADRTAALGTSVSADHINLPADPGLASQANDHHVSRGKGSTGGAAAPEYILAKVRKDLGEAQRSRGLMETRLDSVTEELKKLKIQSSLESRRINELTREKATLTIRVRDRDEELKGKAKLLEDVHDETVSLTLQLNMAEERSQKLRRENQDLVDRWMARMAQEADAMNEESKIPK